MFLPIFSRAFSTSIMKQRKVAVLGAAGGIGQPLSLLLKDVPTISQLALYDISPLVPGIAADLSHISTESKVTGHSGESQLGDALKNADVVVIPAGVPRKPGMTRDDLFKVNANIVYNLATACAKNCPEAHLLIISNPVNSTVPIVAEALKKHGVYDWRRVYGVTTLDIVRARRFVYEAKNLKSIAAAKVNVIGGHSGHTIVPLFSQIPNVTFTKEELDKLTHRVQFGGDEVVQAKAGAGSATLSMAYAAREFTLDVLKALDGQSITQTAYVQSNITKAPYFASSLTIGPEGIKQIHPVGKISAYEEKLLDVAIPELLKNIESAHKFVQSK